jgi:uncharacterized cupin superfamily protein
MVPEAPLERVDGALVPQGDGWFVLNARDARWRAGHFGAYTQFEGEARFAQIGVNIGVLQPGQPGCMYHGEADQEDFLVLSGECIVLVEGQERRLRQFDLFHSPAWTEHVFVGAGDGPCAVLAIGGRSSREVVYPVNDIAMRYGAGVEERTEQPETAYARFPKDGDARFRNEWLGLGASERD